MAQITVTFDLTPETHALLGQLINTGSAQITKKEKAEPRHDAKPEKAEPEPQDKPEKKVSLSDVRALALKLSKSGKQDAIKKIFAKYNAEKLSDISESDYPSLMKDLVQANE